MSSYYTAQTPHSIPIDPRTISFFEKFFELSDNPSTHEEYAQCFTPNAEFAMASRKAVEYKDILALRHTMWSGHVIARKHKVEKIFPFGNDSNELMLYGTVHYDVMNGKKLDPEWAARAILVEHEGALRFGVYQVYLDSTPIITAVKGVPTYS